MRPRFTAPRFAAGAAVTIALLTSPAARAWVFHEHWRIGEAAIAYLPGPERAELDALWDDLRRVSRQQLCRDPARIEEGPGDVPACLTFPMLPAVAGDHSCSPVQLARIVDGAEWLLRVTRIAVETEKGIDAATTQREHIDRWNAMHLALQRADREYSLRATGNDGHFLLPRAGGDLRAYLAKALASGEHISAAALYAIYHLSALDAARAYARASAGSLDRATLARRTLMTEAFALHFLEDAFSAGHFVGAWGDNATKKGTHDLYSAQGIDAFTWTRVPYSAHGDAFLKPADQERAGSAVALSLEAVLAAARGAEASTGEGAAVPRPTAPLFTYDACKAIRVDVALPGAAVESEVAPVWANTPMPSSPRDQTPPIRKRAEIGPFILFQSGGSPSVNFGGFQTQDPGAPRPAFKLSAAIGIGYAIEGLTTSGGDGKFFAAFGIEEQAAQYDVFCSGACADYRTPSGVVPRVPARHGYQLRARMPFWLIPGDLLVAAPILLFTSPHDLATMGIVAADGGLIPWQRVFPTSIGDFQFMLGREFALTLFDTGRSEPFIAYTGTDSEGNAIYDPTRVRSLQLELPVVEYRAFRSFSEKLGASFVIQLGAGLEVPLTVQPKRTDLPPPDIGQVWSAYLRLFFDGRGYL